MQDKGRIYIKFIYTCERCPNCLNIGYNEYWCEELKEKFIDADKGIYKNCKLEYIDIRRNKK